MGSNSNPQPFSDAEGLISNYCPYVFLFFVANVIGLAFVANIFLASEKGF